MSQLNTDQLLMKLSMLQGRAQTDFKGHIVEPERRNTRQSVMNKKAAEERKLVGGVFVPFYQGKNARKLNVQFDACKRSTTVLPLSARGLIDKENPNTVGSHHTTENQEEQDHNFKAELDSTTGKPILNTALYSDNSIRDNERYTIQPTPHSNQYTPPLNSSDISSNVLYKGRPTYIGLSIATEKDRLTMLQDDRMLHPTYTNKSRIYHADSRWMGMTQLTPAFADPSGSDRINLRKKENHHIKMRNLSRKMIVPDKAWR